MDTAEDATVPPATRRWPLAVASALLLGSAVATARSTYLFWLPCRDNMTRGIGSAQRDPGAPIPEACLLQMDAGTPFPYAGPDALQVAAGPQLGAVAMLLAGAAGLVLVLGLRWSLRSKLVALLPGLLALGLGLASARAVAFDGARAEAYPSTVWWSLLEVAALVALAAAAFGRPQLRGWSLAGLTLILFGVTAFGTSHFMLDYMVMITVNDWNWDCPPGCGYPTALVIAVAGVAAAAAALRPTRFTGPYSRSSRALRSAGTSTACRRRISSGMSSSARSFVEASTTGAGTSSL
jgi:hypothetical protein